jgi:alkylhydroperoxidase/carboxymuconolactone decarboxylase family protein YurZ
MTGRWQDVIGRVELTDRQRLIRDEFTRRRSYWADDWQLILELDAEFMAAYTDVSAYAVEHGGLDLRMRELIYVACGSQVTHQHPIGILTHGRNALRAGASPLELLAVMELVSTMGLATVQLAVEELERAEPGIVDALAGAAADGTDAATVERRFDEVFGAWDPDVRDVIRATPEFASALVEMAAVPRLSSVLSPREIALITVAVDAFPTNLDVRALRRDIAAAQRAGVTAAELLDVCVQVCGVGIHAVTVGVPILAELMLEQAEQPA